MVTDSIVKPKKVLVVDDDRKLAALLKRELERCGFETYVANDAGEARRLAELHWGELDVAVLDMMLKDPNEPQTTGAEIGIQFRTEKTAFPPEFLIYSTRSEVNFYRLALRLGAAAYLLKEEDDLSTVAQHVRFLALRRALSGENLKGASEVARIAVRSGNQSEAVSQFCRRVLKPEFESCLGASFVILFTRGGATQNCADNAGLPEESLVYDTVQEWVYGNANRTEPFVLDTRELEPPSDQTALLYKKLESAAFLPLSASDSLRVTIGILQPEQDNRVSGRAGPKELCTLLAQYLRPAVLGNVLSIWSNWTELRATRTSTAKLCLSVGQEINDGLGAADLGQLEELAADLYDTGQLLIELDRHSGQDEDSAISVRDVVEASWQWIAESQNQSAATLDLKSDCAVQAHRSDLEIIISRLLQWFAYRSKATPVGVEPLITIECKDTNNGAVIIFEDNSHRLPLELRKDLFAPFTQAIPTPFPDIGRPNPQVNKHASEPAARRHLNAGRYLPLYVAKMLVEGRYHGRLEDHSDETQRTFGHRILMQFPKVG